MIKTKIAVTFQKAGFHHYPGAPLQVDYLTHKHRHMFKFKVTVQVGHDNREIEFHMFLSWLEQLFETRELDIDFKSCEMLAKDVLDKIMREYGTGREVTVEVWEDGECGGIVEYIP